MSHHTKSHNQPESSLRLAKLNLLNQDNKSYLIYDDKLVSMLIKFDSNKYHMDSLSLLKYASMRFDDHFVHATQIEMLNDEMYLVYDLENHSFLDFSLDKFEVFSPYNSLITFKNYMKSLFIILLLNKDFTEFDSKFFFYFKCPKSGEVRIRYLYHGKKVILKTHSIII